MKNVCYTKHAHCTGYTELENIHFASITHKLFACTNEDAWTRFGMVWPKHVT